MGGSQAVTRKLRSVEDRRRGGREVREDYQFVIDWLADERRQPGDVMHFEVYTKREVADREDFRARRNLEACLRMQAKMREELTYSVVRETKETGTSEVLVIVRSNDVAKTRDYYMHEVE